MLTLHLSPINHQQLFSPGLVIQQQTAEGTALAGRTPQSPAYLNPEQKRWTILDAASSQGITHATCCAALCCQTALGHDMPQQKQPSRTPATCDRTKSRTCANCDRYRHHRHHKQVKGAGWPQHSAVPGGGQHIARPLVQVQGQQCAASERPTKG